MGQRNVRVSDSYPFVVRGARTMGQRNVHASDDVSSLYEEHTPWGRGTCTLLMTSLRCTRSTHYRRTHHGAEERDVRVSDHIFLL